MGADYKVEDCIDDVVLFDGHCNLCSASVDFIINRDPRAKFRFASLQSPPGKKLMSTYCAKLKGIDSVVLVQKQKIYLKSNAAIKIASKLSGFWPFLFVFWVVPAPIRDVLYDIVAKNRYRWFGKMDVCRMPSPELKERFLDCGAILTKFVPQRR